ncbi:chromatin structure-remodeling complex subunit RSC7 [Hypoxylon texense]
MERELLRHVQMQYGTDPFSQTDASSNQASSYDGPDLLDPTRDWPVSTAYPYPESAGHLLRPSTSWEDRLEPLARQGPFSWELTPEVEVVFQVGKPKLANEKVVRVECLRLPEETVVVSPWGTTKTLREEGLRHNSDSQTPTPPPPKKAKNTLVVAEDKRDPESAQPKKPIQMGWSQAKGAVMKKEKQKRARGFDESDEEESGLHL